MNGPFFERVSEGWRPLIESSDWDEVHRQVVVGPDMLTYYAVSSSGSDLTLRSEDGEVAATIPIAAVKHREPGRPPHITTTYIRYTPDPCVVIVWDGDVYHLIDWGEMLGAGGAIELEPFLSIDPVDYGFTFDPNEYWYGGDALAYGLGEKILLIDSAAWRSGVAIGHRWCVLDMEGEVLTEGQISRPDDFPDLSREQLMFHMNERSSVVWWDQPNPFQGDPDWVQPPADVFRIDMAASSPTPEMVPEKIPHYEGGDYPEAVARRGDDLYWWVVRIATPAGGVT